MKQCNWPTLDGIQYVLKKNQFIDIPSKGTSMYPFIQEGDICRFIPLGSSIKRGDIVLFISDQGSLVGHRFQYSYEKEGQLYYVFKGDTNVMPDPPVVKKQLVGKLTQVRKEGFILHLEGRAARAWGGLVNALPVLPRWCKSYHYYSTRIKSRLKERYHA